MGVGLNEDLLEKTIETTDIGDNGLLTPEQQDNFVTLVKQFSVLLPLVRFIRMDRPSMDVDKLHVGEPVTISADENTNPGVFQKPTFNKVNLTTRKVQSAWNVTTETLQANIAQDGFEDTVMTAFTKRIATDLELLALQGDTTVVPADPFTALLVRLDGWLKQTDGAHILNAGGAMISKSIFSAAKRRLPKQYKADPDLKFLVSDSLATDWMDVVATRETIGGDAALQGSGIAPFGIPMMVVNLLPDDVSVPSATATPADVLGTRAGPFIFTGANNVLRIRINAAPVAPAVTTIVITPGTHDTVEVARQINAALAVVAPPGNGAVASDNGEGKLRITTSTTGAAPAAQIERESGAASGWTTLGITEAATPGASTSGAAAGSGSTFDGSVILLCNPQNFLWGILDGTRMYTEFNKDFDRVETVVFNQVSAAVENLDAIVKVTNIRKRPEVI